MRTTCPFVEKFFVDVETYYYPDAGQQVHVNVKKKMFIVVSVLGTKPTVYMMVVLRHGTQSGQTLNIQTNRQINKHY